MDIFVIKLSATENFSPELLNEFKKKEITDKKRLKQHCFSYLMLDRILTNFYNINDYEVIFEHNKPFLKNKQKYFSISHSEEYIVLCFSDYDCGVDIEKMKDRKFQSIAKRLGFKSHTREEFYKEWTTYEAKYKLNQSVKALKSFQFDNYTLTAVSNYKDEIFNLYYQSNN